MKDQEQPFAAFVFGALAGRSAELGRRWVDRARVTTAGAGEPDSDGNAYPLPDAADGLVRAVLASAADGTHRHESLLQTGTALGVEAHRRNTSLQLMLRDVDLLGALVLRAAERIAVDYPGPTAGHEGLALARRIVRATSQLRLAAVTGYTQAIEDELRERYRTIRHDLRNPLGTIKTAIALLTDESTPAEMRESPRVRAMVVRNTSSLDQMISEALGDAAARLPAFGTSQETPDDLPADPSHESTPSGRKQRDDVSRAREGSDLDPGGF